MPQPEPTEGRPAAVSTVRGMIAAPALALTLVLAGCSFSISFGGVSASDIEDEIAATLADDPAADTGTVECSGGLEPTVGDTTECEIVLNGVRADWIVEATEVDDERVGFAWRIVDGSQTLLVDALVDILGDAFAAEVGSPLAAVSCPVDEIPGEVGSTVICDATAADGRTGGIEISITGVSGMTVDLNWSLL